MSKIGKRLKIALTSWAPFVGGAEIAVERLAVGLREAGHDVLLVVGTEGEALTRFRDAGIRCEFIPQQFTDKRKWLRYRKSRSALVNLLRQERSDLLHSNDLPTHQLASDAGRRLDIPRICHHRWIFNREAIDWLNKFGAEQHLFVSNSLMELLCDRSAKLRMSPRTVVYDGLPIPDVPTEADRQQAKQELGLPVDKVVVLFAGQIIERKGVADLLRGWAALPDGSRARADLIVVGDDLENEGAYRREMERLARELGQPVRFTGFQRNVPRWLTAADVVLVPSHAEPLGNATLEAMALGRPVIGSDVGGIPEMIEHERTGLIVPPKLPGELAAAMERLVAGRETRERLGREARRQCERRFQLQAHVENVLAQYQVLLNSKTLAESA
ncbi:glycosyltransferase family 4 protein [Candidatus Laterigemmans baculatus]|uniref:glycosyltransferase family 4 protein n=1 Tax=Candidatus Laterigemmans baculatus TaxID=2770505 RepID=UPI0013DA10FB|nr:glycosyltransferase family 4 protein [Candidatus Laterigemmans baculatus]